jgi:hypothetical protein
VDRWSVRGGLSVVAGSVVRGGRRPRRLRGPPGRRPSGRSPPRCPGGRWSGTRPSRRSRGRGGRTTRSRTPGRPGPCRTGTSTRRDLTTRPVRRRRPVVRRRSPTPAGCRPTRPGGTNRHRLTWWRCLGPGTGRGRGRCRTRRRAGTRRSAVCARRESPGRRCRTPRCAAHRARRVRRG